MLWLYHVRSKALDFQFTYLPSSPHIPYLTRGLQTWPWEGCRGNWLPAWGLYLISKECPGRGCIPCKSRSPRGCRCCPAVPPRPRESLVHAGGLHAAACAACGTEHVCVAPSEQTSFCPLFLALPLMHEYPWS